MASIEEVESLEIFIESASELETSQFAAQAGAGISTSMKQIGNYAVLLERRGPENEAVKSLLLTIRFFCQDNETSIRTTDELIQGLTIPDALKTEFSTLRGRLNAYLDGEPSVRFQSSVGADKRLDIFNAYLYGSFAHANRVKRHLVKGWEEQPYGNDLRAEFDTILVAFVNSIVLMKAVCINVMEELRKTA